MISRNISLLIWELQEDGERGQKETAHRAFLLHGPGGHRDHYVIHEGRVQALLSFQMMYEMRIIVISEGLPESSPFLQELIQADIQNVVSAEKKEMIQDEIRECFSEVGMLRRKAEGESISIEAMPQLSPVEEVTQFRFNCTNVTIAIVGCDRRVGVTTTSFNLVCWINAH